MTENKWGYKDSQGRWLAVGQAVAYNMGGDVVPGEIVGFCGSHIKVWCLLPRFLKDKNHVSKVRRGRSILIIDGCMDPTELEKRVDEVREACSLILQKAQLTG